MFKLFILPLFALVLSGFFGRVPSVRAGLWAVSAWWAFAAGIVWWIFSSMQGESPVNMTFTYFLLIPIPLLMFVSGFLVFTAVALYYGTNQGTEVKARRQKAAIEAGQGIAGALARFFSALEKRN